MMSVMVSSLALKQHALEIGFDLVGIAPASALQDLAFARDWVERGFGGEMRYLENPARGDPRRVLPSVKSVVCVGLVYNAALPYSTEVEREEPEARSQVRFRARNRSDLRNGQTGGPEEPPSRWGPAEPATREELPRSNKTQPDDSGLQTTDEGPKAWISRYAWGRDYHEVMREKLERLRAALEALAPGAETRVYVDTGPIVERAFARLSGIGWMGKNTCLINERKGSWFFLGVILISFELQPDLPAPDRCGSCNRCIEACPTGALVEPYLMDASRCIAYLNIELRGSIPTEFRSAIGVNVFGCDICQDVCPWNGRAEKLPSAASASPRVKGYGRQGAAATPASEFQPMMIEIPAASSQPTGPPRGFGPAAPSQNESGPTSTTPDTRHPTPAFSLFHPPLEALARLSEGEFRAAFARSPIKRVKYHGWLRNLCVAMGNSRDPRFAPRLKELAAHPDQVVREHADWALENIERDAGKE